MILITGATGFVGGGLIARLAGEDRSIRAAVRLETRTLPPGLQRVVVGELGNDTDWRRALTGATTVVHLAARVHRMNERGADPLAEFRRVNVDGTLSLARQAATSGTRRLVYVSSIKVNGDLGAFTELDAPAPQDPYGVSKHEAEVGLRRTAEETGLEVVIVRPPLVYGPGVQANFRTLMRAVSRGYPLPLGAVHNRRSLVALQNLADFLVSCIDHPAAANQTFFVSDGEDLSTTELVRRIARAMGRPARLVPVPERVLRAGASLIGRRDVAQRLLGSLQVDIAKARHLLGWRPPIDVDQALTTATAEFAK